MAFEFGMNLTGTFAAQLGPINTTLAETVPLLDKVVIATDYMDEAMARAASTVRHTNLTLADHMKIAQGFSNFARAAGEASLSVEQHAQVAQGLGAFFGSLGKMAEASVPKVRRFHIEWGNMFHSFAGLRYDREKGFIFNIAESLDFVAEKVGRTGERLIEFARRAGEALWDLGKDMVRVGGETQDLDLALELNLGKEGAGKVDELAGMFEKKTRFDKDAIKGALLPLTEQGVTDVVTLKNFTTAAIDIATRRKQGIEGVQAIVGELARMELGGKLKDTTLKDLAIRPKEFYAELGALLHKSEEQVKKMLKAGDVDTKTTMSVVLSQIAKRQGGKLGIASLAGGDTLGATLQRLHDLPDNLWQAVAHSPALKQVQRVLDNLIDRMSGPEGVRLVESFANAVERALTAVRPEDITKMFENLATIVQGMIKGLGLAVELAGKLADWADKDNARDVGERGRVDLGGGRAVHYDKKDMLTAAQRGGLGWWGEHFLAPIDIERLGQAQLAKEAAAAGVRVGEGLAAGMDSSKPLVAAAAANLAATTAGTMCGDLKIQSPSRVAFDIGGYYGEGYALGIEDQVDRVARAGRAITAASSVGSGRGDYAGAALGFAAPGAKVEVHVVQYITGRDAADCAEQSGQQFERVMEQVLRRSTQQMAGE